MAASDVVVIGGGPAGTVTALALVHAAPSLAERVVVLEKAHYPRDKPCAGALGGRGDEILERLDARPDVPSVSVSGMSFRSNFGEAAAEVAQIGRVVRRIEFDDALAQIARARGVRVVEGAKVERIDREGARATVVSSAGSFDATVVIGADGVGSVVRKAMGLGAGTMRAQVLELDTDPVDADRDRRLLHFDASDRGLSGYYWDFPTIVGGRQLVCRGIYHLKIDDRELDLQARLGTRMSALGLDVRAYKNKRYAERGMDFDERLSMGRLMLVGEAAGIDPITGEGIAQAIEYAALAGEFVAKVLSHREEMSRWTSIVHRSRLGIDLRLRRRLVHTLFGPRRPQMERLLLEAGTLRCGGRHFGALRQSSGDLARLALQLGKIWLGP